MKLLLLVSLAAAQPSLDVTSMDRAVDPCVDFYAYTCEGWRRNNPLPPDQSSWSVYSKLQLENQAFLDKMLKTAAAAKGGSPSTRRLGDFYASCMDEAAVEKRGLSPLAPELAAIEAVTDLKGLAPLFARLQPAVRPESWVPLPGGGMVFRLGSAIDLDDSTKQIADADQGGLGLPDRDYYTRDDDKSKETRSKYLAHARRIFELMGDPKPDESAQTVMRFETALASASLTKVERRDPYNLKHKMTKAELAALAPRFDWPAYFAALKAPPFETLNVSAPAFFKRFDDLLGSEALPAWKTYMRFRLVDDSAYLLGKAFVDENFDFYSRHLQGAVEQKPRWKRCVAITDDLLADDLGRIYAEKRFSSKLKDDTNEMTRRIEKAMEERIRGLDWMSAATKERALEKLRSIRNKVGYPNRWLKYEGLALRRGDFAGNVLSIQRWETRRQFAKIGAPVDREEWLISAATVNAWYDPQLNEVVFPAGILQPPLYSPDSDAAPNYGNTGGTIGHELTHGFDDEGRQYDAKGNLKVWWTDEDAEKFKTRAACIKDQYSEYVAIDDIKVNGALTLGEDVADLGGLIIAYYAWKAAHPAAQTQDGLTPDQRFFVGYAQWACNNERPEKTREEALTDVHSPPKYRVNGVIVNMPEFARAFGCRADQPMAKPADKVCRVW